MCRCLSVYRFHSPDYEGGLKREWLLANGLGGYASSTITGANSRKYHGLLVAALNPPVDRRVLLSSMDETLQIAGEQIELSVHKYPLTLHPRGFEYLKCFELQDFPCFVYEAQGVILEKRVFMEQGRNVVFLEYHVCNHSHTPCTLVLRPLVTNRSFHATKRRHESSFECEIPEQNLCVVRDAGKPVLSLASAVQKNTDSDAVPVRHENWYYNVEYDVERLRGQDYQEDLYSPGYLTCTIKEDATLYIAASTPAHGYEPSALKDACAMAQQIKEREVLRRERLIARAGASDAFHQALVLSADSFIVSRGAQRSIIAGYHWFSDWGRDTMISLPGLTLATRRFEDARHILTMFADNIWQGLLPNRFTESGGSEYNTVDASLWFIHACHRYLEYTEDVEFVKNQLWPGIKSIIAYYRGGTEGVHADSDGLIVSAPQMTWMDAKLGDWIVTPRAGKACEINALWYNALMSAADMAELFEEDGSAYLELGEAVKKSYAKFWNPEQHCLFDLIDPLDDSIRPNQVFAVSLPHQVVSRRQGAEILKVVERLLLTPFGLRTLAPGHPDYRPHYRGDAASRDAAYHQGTVWPWLLGGFITAYLNVHGRSEKNLESMRELLRPLEEHLGTAGLGSISEVFDAEPPHEPGGCIMQAWSVAKILRCVSEELK